MSDCLDRLRSRLDASPSETVYVGDSLMKDIAMAQDVGVFDVLTEYGAVHDPSAYRLLQQVSHWNEDDVQREIRISARPHVQPSYILKDRFDEIFDFFRFGDQA